MNLLFLGDSITEAFPVQTFFKNHQVVNQGISGISSGELLDRMQDHWFEPQPERVFLCIGTNDLARSHPLSDIIDNQGKAIDRITRHLDENGKIFLSSVFPTRDNPARPNTLIDELNIQLHQLAQKKGIQYLHLNPFFKDSTLRLRHEFTDDGLHLTLQAYQYWANHLEALLK